MADKRITELTNITGANLADADEFVVVDSSASETKAITRSELGLGINRLGYNGTQKIITTSTGVDVTGTVTADGLVLSDGGDRTITGPLNNDLIINSRGNTPGEGTRIQSFGVDRLLVDDTTGDISFYEDTGTTPKFFWDASAEALLLGTTTPVSNNRLVIEQASGDGANSGFYLQRNGAAGQSFKIDIDSSDVVNFRRSTVQAMAITTAGNVGIGTSSPSQILTVNGERAQFNQTLVGISTPLQIRNGGAATNGRGAGLEFIGSSNTFGRIEGFWSGTDEQVRLISTGSTTFRTSGSERMRIDSSGNLLVGATAVGGAGGISIAPNQIAGAGQIAFNRNSTTSTSFPMDFRNGGSTVGYIAYTNTVVIYSTTSDYRLKEDIQPLTGASDRVLALNPVNFAWKADGARVDGFIAHEAQAVVPEAVTGEKDAVDADGNPVYQGIDQSKLVPLLTAALQEALGRITALEARVAALEA